MYSPQQAGPLASSRWPLGVRTSCDHSGLFLRLPLQFVRCCYQRSFAFWAPNLATPHVLSVPLPLNSLVFLFFLSCHFFLLFSGDLSPLPASSSASLALSSHLSLPVQRVVCIVALACSFCSDCCRTPPLHLRAISSVPAVQLHRKQHHITATAVFRPDLRYQTRRRNRGSGSNGKSSKRDALLTTVEHCVTVRISQRLSIACKSWTAASRNFQGRNVDCKSYCCRPLQDQTYCCSVGWFEYPTLVSFVK